MVYIWNAYKKNMPINLLYVDDMILLMMKK